MVTVLRCLFIRSILFYRIFLSNTCNKNVISFQLNLKKKNLLENEKLDKILSLIESFQARSNER